MDSLVKALALTLIVVALMVLVITLYDMFGVIVYQITGSLLGFGVLAFLFYVFFEDSKL